MTVDIVLLTTVERRLEVLLIQRGNPPYEGAWALPGGFVEPDEDLAEAAVRELLEETGIGVEPGSLLQVGAYGHPDRDPRMRVVTVAYGAIVTELDQVPRGGSDAAHAGLVPVADVQSGRVTLAFDHRQIVEDAVSGLWSDPDTGRPPAGTDPIRPGGRWAADPGLRRDDRRERAGWSGAGAGLWIPASTGMTGADGRSAVRSGAGGR